MQTRFIDMFWEIDKLNDMLRVVLAEDGSVGGDSIWAAPVSWEFVKLPLLSKLEA
mgnify:CR=1 FL=1